MYNVWCMKRTQIYLPEALHHELLTLAKQESSSISEIIRKTVGKSLAQKMEKRQSPYKFFDWLIREGKKPGKKLPKDFSRRHTEYYLETLN